MADVRISVELDGLQRALHGLDRLEEALDDLAGAGARVRVATKGVSTRLRQQNDVLKSNAARTRANTQEQHKLSDSFGRVIKNLNRLFGKLRTLLFFSGLATASLVALRQEIVALAAAVGGVLAEVQLENARQRLQTFAETANLTQSRLESLGSVAQQAGARFSGVVDQMADLTASVVTAGGSVAEAESVMQSFLSAGISMGQTTGEMASVLEDLNGMVKDGTFEMRDLADALSFTNNPVQVLAESFNTTESRIRDMMEAGAQLNRSALIPVSRTLDDMSRNSDTLTGAFNSLVNAALSLFDAFNRAGFMDALIGQMQRLAEILRSDLAISIVQEIGRQMATFVSTTLPNFVTSFINSWEAILDTLRTVAGVLIGLAAGGVTGGLIGGIIGAHDDLRNAVLSTAGSFGSFLFDVVKAMNGIKSSVSENARIAAEFINLLDRTARLVATSIFNMFKSVGQAIGAVFGALRFAAVGNFEAASNVMDQFTEDFMSNLENIRTEIDATIGQMRTLARETATSGPDPFTTDRPSRDQGGGGRQVDMGSIMSEINKQIAFLERGQQGWRQWAASAMDAIKGVRMNLRNLKSNMGFFGRAVISVATDFGTLAQSAQRVGGAIQNSFTTAFSSVFRGAQSMGDALESAFESIVDALIQELARLAANEVFRIFLDILGIREGPHGSTLGGLVGNRGGGATGTGSLVSAGFLGGGGGAAVGTTAAGVGGNVPGLAGTSGTTGAAAGASTMAGFAALGAIFANMLGAEDIESSAGAAFGGVIGGAFGGPIGAAFGSTIGGALFQTGGSKIVSSPTMIGVGEHGQPEKVTVEPLSGSRSEGGGTIVFNGPTIVDEIGMNRFSRRVRDSLRREQRRSVV